MKTFTIDRSVTVTQEQIDDVVTTALEGGITYWCDAAYAEPVVNNKYCSEMLTLGSTIKLHAIDEKEWHSLTLDKLLEAFKVLNFDFDDYDAGDADNAVQQAVFGELVYG